jgi:hypothetical protein
MPASSSSSLTRRALLAGAGAAGAALATGARVYAASKPPVVVAPFNSAQWRRVWTTDFGTSCPLGAFPQAVSREWSAFHHGSFDTAAKRGIRPGGVYDPATTTWISGGYLHVRQWRPASGGRVHCGAPWPRPADGVLYGRFVEVTRVSVASVGYKSAHLLWPTVSPVRWEIDWPENNWRGVHATPHGFDHFNKNTSNDRLAWPTGASWTAWHTYEIRWAPSYLALYIDGHRVGYTGLGAAVPKERMGWRLQNESAIVGSGAAPGSHAQIDTSHLEYWAWRG